MIRKLVHRFLSVVVLLAIGVVLAAVAGAKINLSCSFSTRPILGHRNSSKKGESCLLCTACYACFRVSQEQGIHRSQPLWRIPADDQKDRGGNLEMSFL